MLFGLVRIKVESVVGDDECASLGSDLWGRVRAEESDVLTAAENNFALEQRNLERPIDKLFS